MAHRASAASLDELKAWGLAYALQGAASAVRRLGVASAARSELSFLWATCALHRQAERAILSSDTLVGSMRDLNLLADLIGSGLPSDDRDDGFKLNLFPDTAIPEGGGGGGAGMGAPVIMIDGGGSKALQASNRNLMGIMDDMRQPGGGALGMGGDDDDLLGLMDAAER